MMLTMYKHLKMSKKPQLPTANADVLEETSLELGLPIHLVKEVVQAQSDFTVDTIRRGEFQGVLWPLFGKIKVKVSKVHVLHERLGGREIKKNTENL